MFVAQEVEQDLVMPGSVQKIGRASPIPRNGVAVRARMISNSPPNPTFRLRALRALPQLPSTWYCRLIPAVAAYQAEARVLS
jgi:hypothetical protein